MLPIERAVKFIRDYFRPHALQQRGAIGQLARRISSCPGLFKSIALRRAPARLLGLRTVAFRNPPRDRRVVGATRVREDRGSSTGEEEQGAQPTIVLVREKQIAAIRASKRLPRRAF